MTTVQAFLDRVRRDWLMQTRIEGRNFLAIAIDDNDTALSFVRDLDGIVQHSIISIGLEDLYVFDAVSTTKTADVDRGIDGTTAIAHLTTELVRVAPRWTDAQILRGANDELGNLYGEGLFGLGFYEFTYQPPAVGIPLPADVIEVVDVSVQDFVGADWVKIAGWEERHNQNATDFPTGNALFFKDAAPFPGRTVRVEYKKVFTALSTLSQDVSAISGLPATAIDVLGMGTAIALTTGREIGKNLAEAQGSTRRSNETQTGAEAQAMRPVIRNYERRLARERTILRAKYPTRMRNF